MHSKLSVAHAQTQLANMSHCPSDIIFMSCFIIVIFSHSLLPLQNGHPWLFTMSQLYWSAYMPLWPGSNPSFYLAAFISHSINFQRTLFLSLSRHWLLLVSIAFLKQYLYLIMTDLCILPNAVHSRCSRYQWLKQCYNSRKITMTLTVMNTNVNWVIFKCKTPG